MIYIYLAVTLLISIRGLLAAQDYWDYKAVFVNDIPFNLMILVVAFGLHPSIIKSIIQFTTQYVFIFSFLLIPLALSFNDEIYSRLVIASGFLVFFVPFLGWKQRIIIVMTTVLSMTMALEFRAGLVKNGFAFVLLIAYLTGLFQSNRVYILTQRLLFIVPIVFLILGSNGIYNIFQPLDYKALVLTKAGGEETNLLTDSRTFIYKEIAAELDKTDSWILGKGAGGSYSSVFFDTGGAVAGKRYSSEVGFMNRLLKGGILSVIIYSFMVYIISRNAILQSNNQLAKILSLAIASRWSFSFFEEFSLFDINSFYLSLIMGLVSVNWFIKMDDSQVRRYLKNE